MAGLDLLTWRFEEGRAVKHTKQTWLSGTTEPVVTFPEEAKLVATSRKSGTIMLENGTRYTFTLNDSADSVLVETSTGKSGSTSLTYYTNYEDKGPGFVNRVKGKTYRKYAANGKLETEYKFSADGTQLDLIYTTAFSSWGGMRATYTYAPSKDKGTSGKYVYAVYGSYYVDLTDGNDGRKDAVVRMENTAAASDYWTADMEYEATLVESE